jgi:hypothetical protein
MTAENQPTVSDSFSRALVRQVSTLTSLRKIYGPSSRHFYPKVKKFYVSRCREWYTDVCYCNTVTDGAMCTRIVLAFYHPSEINASASCYMFRCIKFSFLVVQARNVSRVNLKIRFEVLTATSMKMTVFWDVAPCSRIDIDWRFGWAYCLHHHGFFNFLMRKVVRSSGKSVNIYHTTGCYIPEDNNLHKFNDSWYFLNWSRNSSPFMEPECPLPFSEKATNELYPVPAESSPSLLEPYR